MRLFFPSLIAAAYIFFSLILPLHVRAVFKILLGLAAFCISLKYFFYEYIGGSFFCPVLPLWVHVLAEALYASLILLFFLALLKDVGGLCLAGLRYAGFSWRLPFSPEFRSIVLTVLALTTGAWGTWQSVKIPELHNMEIAIPQLPQDLDGYTLVQLTDLHVGPLLKKDWLQQVVNKANAVHADAIVITGDLIDGFPHQTQNEVTPLADLRAADGIFGVTGNHEYYYNAEGWTAVFRSLGIDMLHNEHHILRPGLILGGVPDPTEKRMGGAAPSVVQTFAQADNGIRILLSHQPHASEEIPAQGISLQLSGHTHGGLMFFLAPLIGAFNQGYVCGLYQTAAGGSLYVSPGTGLWSGFSCRVGVPSEITRIKLRKK
jgi:hypothetical protein